MFYRNQLPTLENTMNNFTGDAELTNNTEISCSLEDGLQVIAHYVNEGTDPEGEEWGTIMFLIGDDAQTEVDSLPIAEKVFEKLARQHGYRDAEQHFADFVDTAMMDHYDMANGDIGDIDLFESATRPATDDEKYFLYKVDQLKTEQNAAKLEAVVKAFGLIRKVDTTLSDKEKEQFAYFESLEKARGNQPKKAFIESITNEAMKRVNKEQFGEVRNAINAYRTWILGKSHACMESMAGDTDNYNSIVNTLKQEGATITDAESFANKLSEHGIQATVKNDTVTVQRPDGTFDDYKPWGQFTNGTPRWVKRWSDDYGRMNYLDPSSLLVDVFMFAHKLPDIKTTFM